MIQKKAFILNWWQIKGNIFLTEWLLIRTEKKVRKIKFCKHSSKNYSDKNYQKMLNLEVIDMMRNTMINTVSKFFLTNYLLVAKGKTVTIQWRNWTTCYSSDQNWLSTIRSQGTFCASGTWGETALTILPPTLHTTLTMRKHQKSPIDEYSTL